MATSFQRIRELINNPEADPSLLNNAFLWRRMPEGDAYWRSVAKKSKLPAHAIKKLKRILKENEEPRKRPRRRALGITLDRRPPPRG